MGAKIDTKIEKCRRKYMSKMIPKIDAEQKVAKRRFWMPFRFPGCAGGGKEDKPPCWQDAGFFCLTLPDTGRCRRIVDAERPPTPQDAGGGGNAIKSKKSAGIGNTGVEKG